MSNLIHSDYLLDSRKRITRPDGSLHSVRSYNEDGKLLSEEIYREDGSVEEKKIYHVDYDCLFESIYYNKDGSVQSSCHYSKGEIAGYKIFYPSGQVKFEETTRLNAWFKPDGKKSSSYYPSGQLHELKCFNQEEKLTYSMTYSINGNPQKEYIFSIWGSETIVY